MANPILNNNWRANDKSGASASRRYDLVSYFNRKRFRYSFKAVHAVMISVIYPVPGFPLINDFVDTARYRIRVSEKC